MAKNKSYDLTLIQEYFDRLDLVHLGEATGEHLANLLIALGWQTDSDIHRTATNCLVWVRRNVRFKQSAQGLSPSKLVRACLVHLKETSDAPPPHNNKQDGETAREPTEREANQPHAAKVAAKDRTAAILKPQKPNIPQDKPNSSSSSSSSNDDDDDNSKKLRGDANDAMRLELAACKEQLVLLRSQAQYTEQQLNQVLLEVGLLRSACQELCGRRHEVPACGCGRASVARMMAPSEETETKDGLFVGQDGSEDDMDIVL